MSQALLELRKKEDNRRVLERLGDWYLQALSDYNPYIYRPGRSRP